MLYKRPVFKEYRRLKVFLSSLNGQVVDDVFRVIAMASPNGNAKFSESVTEFLCQIIDLKRDYEL